MEKADTAAANQTLDRMRGDIGRISLEIEPEALKHIIASGRLLEFVTAVSNQAAAHLSSQIVEKVADLAVGGSGAGASATFVFEGGDFGTVPPRPKFGVGPIPRFNLALQRVALQGADQIG